MTGTVTEAAIEAAWLAYKSAPSRKEGQFIQHGGLPAMRLALTAALPHLSAPAAGLSDEQKHSIAHARLMVQRASPEKPEVCFDYELVASLLAIIDRLAASPAAKDQYRDLIPLIALELRVTDDLDHRTWNEIKRSLKKWIETAVNVDSPPATRRGEPAPEGWKKMPVEPTEAMIEASLASIEEFFKTLPEDHEYRQKGWFNGAKMAARIKIGIRYKAMLAAAPSPPPISGSATKDWMTEADCLFGYFLGCANNQKAVASALEGIDTLLRAGEDVVIHVLRNVSEPAPPTYGGGIEAAARVAEQYEKEEADKAVESTADDSFKDECEERSYAAGIIAGAIRALAPKEQGRKE